MAAAPSTDSNATPLWRTLAIGVGLLAALSIPLAANAEELSPEQALERALSSHSSPRRAKALKASAMKLRYTASADGRPGCYLFTSPGGSLVVPASSEAPAVLGYTDGPVSGELPPALVWWLGEYASQIAFAPEEGGGETSEESGTGTDRQPIEPLLRTLWGQTAPYNDLCPELNGQRTVTGCVATALAQVMAWHQWPTQGTGSNSYTWRGQTLTVDFSQITYDWDNMTPTYSSSSTQGSENAVATLMYSCGVAVDMNYNVASAGGSGASAFSVPGALVQYFGYDSGAYYAPREYYGLEEWNELVYDQLVNCGPVQYSGQNNEGGHSFVCDGYDTDGYFHINWGWNGESNGYFLLTALDPSAQGVGGTSSGYNTSQSVIAGVRRPQRRGTAQQTPANLYCSSNFNIYGSGTNAPGTSLRVMGTILNYGYAPFSGTLGVSVTPQDGGETEYYGGKTVEAMPSGQGYAMFNLTMPELADGVYTVRPAYESETGAWEPVRVRVGYSQYVTMTVSDGEASFVREPQAGVEAQIIETKVPIYLGHEFSFEAEVTNHSDEEFYGNLALGIYTTSKALVGYSDLFTTDVLPGETVNVDFESQFTHLMSQQTLGAGDYMVGVINASSHALLSPSLIPVTVKEVSGETEITASDFQIGSMRDGVVNPSDMDFTVTITCTSGLMDGNLVLAIFPYSSGEVTALAQYSEGLYFVEPGQSKEISMNIDFSQAEQGESYFAVLYTEDGKQLTDPLVFSVDLPTALRTLRQQEAEAEYLTTDGLRLNGRPAVPGLYIRRTPAGARRVVL